MDFDLDRFAVTLLTSMPDAVVYSDAEGKIRFWNKGAEDIFGVEWLASPPSCVTSANDSRKCEHCAGPPQARHENAPQSRNNP